MFTPNYKRIIITIIIIPLQLNDKLHSNKVIFTLNYGCLELGIICPYAIYTVSNYQNGLEASHNNDEFVLLWDSRPGEVLLNSTECPGAVYNKCFSKVLYITWLAALLKLFEKTGKIIQLSSINLVKKYRPGGPDFHRGLDTLKDSKHKVTIKHKLLGIVGESGDYPKDCGGDSIVLFRCRRLVYQVRWDTLIVVEYRGRGPSRHPRGFLSLHWPGRTTPRRVYGSYHPIHKLHSLHSHKVGGYMSHIPNTPYLVT